MDIASGITICRNRWEAKIAKIIEARAVISAEDKTGAVFDKIAKKIDQIAKTGKAAAAVDQISKALERAKTQMAAIDRFNNARSGIPALRARFNEAEQAVVRAAQAMKRGEGNAAALARTYERTQAAVTSAARALERQQTAALANKRALEGMGVNVQRAATHQARLRAEVERTNAALERHAHAQERREGRRAAMGYIAGAAGVLAGHELKRGTREVLHTYREFDKERRFGKAVMGISDADQAPLVAQAIHLGATTKFNDIQVLESQRELAARGLKRDQVMGLIAPAASLGMALDQQLPEAVRGMEAAIFGFKKDMTSLAAATASARQTADYQVKAAKISGMTPEDLRQLYKFGATPARMVGLSEASLLGFGGILKKANIGGDEAGVAFRALVSTLQAPTAGAKTALLANGLNFKNYQRTKDRLDVDPFVADVAARYGVRLNSKTRAGLAGIFANKDLIADPAKFGPAVTGLLRETLGGRDAKSLKSIAGAANRYRDSSVNSIDANAFLRDLITTLPGNLPLANKLFGSKQGGRIATALADGQTLRRIIGEIENGSEGYAGKIASERMAGFDGAVSRFEGAVKNLETAVGRSFDRDGKGGILTGGVDWIGRAIQHAAEANPKLIAGGATAAGVGGVAAAGYGGFALIRSLAGGFGLSASAVALDGSAAALTAAAAALGGKGIVGDLAGKVGAGKTAAASAGGGFLSKAWGAGALALPYLGPAAVGAGAYFGAGYLNEASGITRESTRARQRRQAAKYNWYGKYIGDQEASLPRSDKGTTPVSGDVHGQAEVTVKLDGGSFIQSVARAVMKLTGTISSNGPGSAGHSSPDATAASAGLAGP